MRAALGFSAQGARSLGCAQGVVPSPPFPGGAERPFHPHSPPYSLSPPPGMEPCAAWSPRGGRGTATLPFRGVQQTRGGVGTEGRGRGSTRAGAAPGGDPPAEELGKSGHSRRGDTGRFSAALHPLLLRLSFLLPARAKSFFRPGGGWAGGGGGGRAPFAGSTPLRAEDKALEHSGSSTRAQCARRASLGQERHGIPARTGLGEEAELCALESESPARSGSETTCSCSYLPAPPRKQQCFWRARARVCVCVCGT